MGFRFNEYHFIIGKIIRVWLASCSHTDDLGSFHSRCMVATPQLQLPVSSVWVLTWHIKCMAMTAQIIIMTTTILQQAT
jgi:hypothetical protein